MAKYTALLRTRPSSRIFTRTASVTSETSSADTLTPYNSATWARVSRVVMPRAYIEMTWSSNPGSRRAYFSTNCGSKRPWRSRATSRSSAPSSVSTRLRWCPSRILPRWRFGERLIYIASQWHMLLVLLYDGSVEMDSNFVENRIRSAKLTAKNALFDSCVVRQLATMLRSSRWNAYRGEA